MDGDGRRDAAQQQPSAAPAHAVSFLLGATSSRWNSYEDQVFFFPSKVSNVYIKEEGPREREAERNEPTCARLCTI